MKEVPRDVFICSCALSSACMFSLVNRTPAFHSAGCRVPRPSFCVLVAEYIQRCGKLGSGSRDYYMIISLIAEKHFVQIERAKEVLLDKEMRRKYDEWRRGGFKRVISFRRWMDMQPQVHQVPASGTWYVHSIHCTSMSTLVLLLYKPSSDDHTI